MKKNVSMIHPDMYNRALSKAGIDYITVFDGENGGLDMTIAEVATREKIAAALVGMTLMRHVEHDLVVTSNANAIRNAASEIESILTFSTLDAESREGIDEVMTTLRSVADNLTNMVKDAERIVATEDEA